ncbi:MAG: glycoside hydrolase family 9 protein, partial [Flavobacteriales bacterium]
CDDGSIISGDADWSIDFQREQAVATAAVLFQLTEEEEYNNYVVTHQNDISLLDDNYWGPEIMNVKDALLDYAQNPMSDSELSNDLLTGFTETVQNNWNQLYGEVDNDLYMAYMPDWSYHWGSNMPKAMTGVLNLLINQSEIDQNNADYYQNRAEDHLHYFHGVNPNDLVYLSNMYSYGAEHCVNEIYHTWFHDGSEWDNALASLYGPPPGFVSGGPNNNFTVESLSPPFGQPAQKSYLDFNDNWPNNSWEISEPAIYYQAAYIRLLAAFVSSSDVPDNIAKAEEFLNWKWYPNPGATQLKSTSSQSLEVVIRNALGQNIWTGVLPHGSSIATDNWASGLYFIRSKSNSTVQSSVWIKN